MNGYSLYKRLWWGLLITFGAASLVSALMMYFLAFDDAHHLQDDLLYQLVHAPVSVNDRPPSSDHEWAEQQIHLQTADIDTNPSLHQGFQNVEWRGNTYRAYCKGNRVALQQTESRDELAAERAWRTLLPFLLTLPIAGIVLYFLLSIAFKPILAMADDLKARKELDLSPLPVQSVPIEWQTFVVAFNQLLSRISAAQNRQRKFLRHAAHELRTPFTALILQANNIPRTKENNTELGELQLGLERCSHLLNQLLDADRSIDNIEKKTTINLHSLTLQIIELYHPVLEEKSHTVSIDIPEDLTAKIAKHDFSMLIRNLLANAITYTHKEGNIHISMNIDKKILHIEIEDDGPGIPADERQRVIAPFQRLDQTSIGSGLGLSIVAQIVAKHSGRFSLEDSSRYQTGLCVVVKLPI